MVGGVLQLAVQVPALLAHRGAAAHRPVAARAARGLGAPGRAPRAQADAAGAGRRVGGPALAADQHPDRLACRRRRRVVADLRRPPDGVPDRTARRGAGRGAAAAAVGGAGTRRWPDLLEPARLGPAPGGVAGAAVRGGVAGVSQAPGGRALPLRRVQPARRAADRARADGLRRRPDRAGRREGAGARASTRGRTCARRCASRSACWC